MATQLPSPRDVYANLLRDTRGLRREQLLARDGWYERLTERSKEETLFELEMLLKGVACFGNDRNHPGIREKGSSLSLDYSERLRILSEGAARINTLLPRLLGERGRASTFSRYLESVIPEDAIRGKLLKEQLTQDTPEESLIVLQNSFAAFQDVAEGLLKAGKIEHRVYAGFHGTMVREIGRNVFFNPLLALEFQSEFDRVDDASVLHALSQVHSEAAHRLLALSFLALYRSLHYLDQLDRAAADPAGHRRAYLILAVLRSDLRVLTQHLGRHGASLLAGGMEQEILQAKAAEIGFRREELELSCQKLCALRNALESSATSLRVEIRRIYRGRTPSPEQARQGGDLAPMLLRISASLRAALRSAVTCLCIGVGGTMPRFDLDGDKGQRLARARLRRRELWMFMQITRAFIAKAQATDSMPESWDSIDSHHFVQDFLGHFRALGYQLGLASEYPQIDELVYALAEVQDVDLLETSKLGLAVARSHQFYTFLEGAAEEMNESELLGPIPFDKKQAGAALMIYLGAR